MGYLHILKLNDTVQNDELNPAKNADVFAELIQVLDDRSLSLVTRDTKDNWNNAIKIPREHYRSCGKPKVIALYTEFTTLCKGEAESVTDYMLHEEAVVAALRNVEEVSDALLITMIAKGLSSEYKKLLIL